MNSKTIDEYARFILILSTVVIIATIIPILLTPFQRHYTHHILYAWEFYIASIILGIMILYALAILKRDDYHHIWIKLIVIAQGLSFIAGTIFLVYFTAKILNFF